MFGVCNQYFQLTDSRNQFKFRLGKGEVIKGEFFRVNDFFLR